MKTVIIYYSWSGNTEKYAKDTAAQNGFDIIAVKDKARPGTAAAYSSGVINARRQTRTPIEPISGDIESYEKIIIMAPVWAGMPAPAINNVFDMLPPGKLVEVVLTSKSKRSSGRDKVKALIEARGCTMDSYQDVRL